MLRRAAEAPAGLWMLDGVWFDIEDAYLEALRKRNERRARIAARMWVADGYAAGAPIPLSVPGVTEEAVRHYARQLQPFWSAECGWRYYEDEQLEPYVDAPDGRR